MTQKFHVVIRVVKIEFLFGGYKHLFLVCWLTVIQLLSVCEIYFCTLQIMPNRSIDYAI